MTANENDTRCLIFNTAKTLLNEVEDAGTITVRQIAARAGVGVGLINYYFESKNDLLNAAIGEIVLEVMTAQADKVALFDMEPLERLRVMMRQLLELANNNTKFVRFIFSLNIIKAGLQTPLHIISLLRDIFGDEKDDAQLRVIALQILYPLQAAGLDAGVFHMYSGLDLRDPEDRNKFIDMLINNVISLNKTKKTRGEKK
jgi:AcrR family transcriptional regulator